MPNPTPKAIRLRIVALRKAGKSYDEVARALGVGLATVNRIIQLEKRTGSVDAVSGYHRGPESKLQSEDYIALAEFVEEAPTSTLVELAGRLKEEMKKTVSRATVGRALAAMGLSKKSRMSTQASRSGRPSQRRAGSSLKS